jgi:hypothetical protein
VKTSSACKQESCVWVGAVVAPERGESVDQFMPCPVAGCDHWQWVSPEDSDASFGDLWNHVRNRHPRADVRQVMTRVRLVDEDGNPIKEERS